MQRRLVKMSIKYAIEYKISKIFTSYTKLCIYNFKLIIKYGLFNNIAFTIIWSCLETDIHLSLPYYSLFYRKKWYEHVYKYAILLCNIITTTNTFFYNSLYGFHFGLSHCFCNQSVLNTFSRYIERNAHVVCGFGT